MESIKRSKKPATASFPYEAHKGTLVWNAVSEAIEDMVENQDLVETTPRDYIVGYICKKIAAIEAITEG